MTRVIRSKLAKLAINIDSEGAFFYYLPRAAAGILTLKSNLIYLSLSDDII
jgi:hypothetical protein